MLDDSVEYQVRTVTRYIVTRYGNESGSSCKGEFNNADMAYQVGYALAGKEREQLGYAPGDERVKYPKRPTR